MNVVIFVGIFHLILLYGVLNIPGPQFDSRLFIEFCIKKNVKGLLNGFYTNRPWNSTILIFLKSVLIVLPTWLVDRLTLLQRIVEGWELARVSLCHPPGGDRTRLPAWEHRGVNESIHRRWQSAMANLHWTCTSERRTDCWAWGLMTLTRTLPTPLTLSPGMKTLLLWNLQINISMVRFLKIVIFFIDGF